MRGAAKGLQPHGTGFRSWVQLDPNDAEAVSLLVQERRSTVGAVLRELVVRGLESIVNEQRRALPAR